jgi:opacity protein-like surface antigen
MKLAPLALLLFLLPSPALAQGQSFGIGGRFSLVRGDIDADTSAERFLGGQIRAKLSPRTAIEVALDVRTDTNDALTERIRRYPLQASLLLYPVRSAISPYVLAGGGWYSQRLETLAGDETLTSATTREFGWHAGLGGELRLGSHAGAHADYRYTFLTFGGDDEESDGGVLSRVLPSFRGSMWTAGLTLYF